MVVVLVELVVVVVLLTLVFVEVEVLIVVVVMGRNLRENLRDLGTLRVHRWALERDM